MKRICAAFIIFAVLITTISCSNSEKAYRKTFYGDFFDTVCEFIIYAPSQNKFDSIMNSVEEELSKYHKLLDIYNSYPGMYNVKTINENAGIAPVCVSKELIDILKFCIYTFEVTNGKTNTMIGEVIRIWNEYREKNNGCVPSNNELLYAGAYTDISFLEIDESKMTAYISDSRASLDVGSIAKGYVAEKIADIIYETGYAACINLGGNVKLVKTPHDGYWSVGIKDPFGDSSILKLKLQDGYSVVTSGAYERYFYSDGHRYNHVIDSDTLYPAEFFESVTVISRDSAICDALSTALFCMEREDGERIISKFEDIYVIWIYSDGKCEYSNKTEELFK